MAGNTYFNRKLHSLLGVLPIGFFLIEHMLTNYTAFNLGHQGFIDAVMWLQELPLVLLLEIFFIFLPLLYHAVYGLYMAYQSRNNVSNYGYFRNWMFKLQRITGIVTLIFIVWHLFETRFQVAIGAVEHAGLGVTMNAIASNQVYFALYCVGIISTVFHFSNGLWSFLVSWGITVGPRAQRVSTYACMGIFVVMSVMFILSLSAFLNPEFQEMPTISLGR